MATPSLSELVIQDLEALKVSALDRADYQSAQGFGMALLVLKETIEESPSEDALETSITGLRSLASATFLDEHLVAPLLLAADAIEDTVQRISLREREEGPELRLELEEAEAELLAWTRGERSSLNQQLELEVNPEDRGATLIRVAQQDAAELALAEGRVRALRLFLES